MAEHWANAILDVNNRPVHPIVASPPRNVRLEPPRLFNVFSTHTLFEPAEAWERLYIFHSDECAAPHPWYTVLEREVPTELQEEYFAFLRFVTQRKFVDNVLLVSSRLQMRLLLTAMVHTATYLCGTAPTADLRDTQRNTNRIIPLFSVEQPLDSSDEDRDSGGLVRPVDVLLDTVCELLAVYWPLIRPGQGSLQELASNHHADVLHRFEGNHDTQWQQEHLAKSLQFFESVKFLLVRLLQFRRQRHWLIFWLGLRLTNEVSCLQQAIAGASDQKNDRDDDGDNGGHHTSSGFHAVFDTVAELLTTPAAGLFPLLDSVSVALQRMYCQKLDGKTLDVDIEAAVLRAWGADMGRHLDTVLSLLRLECSVHRPVAAHYASSHQSEELARGGGAIGSRPVVNVLLEAVELIAQQTDVVAPWRAALAQWEQLFEEEQEERARLCGSEAACRHELNESLFLHMLDPEPLHRNVPNEQSLDDILTVKFLFRSANATSAAGKDEASFGKIKAATAPPPYRAPIRETIVPEGRVTEVHRNRKNSVAQQRLVTAMLLAGRNEQHHRCELMRLEQFHREKTLRQFYDALRGCFQRKMAQLEMQCVREKQILELEAEQLSQRMRFVANESFVRVAILVPSFGTITKQVQRREDLAWSWSTTRRDSLVKQVVQRTAEDVFIERQELRFCFRSAIVDLCTSEHDARGQVLQAQWQALERLVGVEVPELVARQSLVSLSTKALHAVVLLLTSEMASHSDFFLRSTADHLLELVDMVPKAHSLLEEVSGSDSGTERGPSTTQSESSVPRSTPWAVLDAEDEARERIVSEQELAFLDKDWVAQWSALQLAVLPEEQQRCVLERGGLTTSLALFEHHVREVDELDEAERRCGSLESSDHYFAIVEWQRAARLLARTQAQEETTRADLIRLAERDAASWKQSFLREQIDIRRRMDQIHHAAVMESEQRKQSLGCAGMYREACALLKKARHEEEAGRLSLIQQWLQDRDALEQLAHEGRLAIPPLFEGADQTLLPQFLPKAPRRPVSASTTASSFGQTEASSLTTFTQNKGPSSRPLTAQLRSKMASPLHLSWQMSASAAQMPRPRTAGRSHSTKPPLDNYCDVDPL